MWSILDNVTGSTDKIKLAATGVTQETAGNYYHSDIDGGFPNYGVTIKKIADAVIDASKVSLNTVWLLGVYWQSNMPVAGSVAWNTHNLYYNGIKYAINSGNSGTANKYIYWKVGDNFYSVSNDFNAVKESFVVCVNTDGTYYEVWNNPAAPEWITTPMIMSIDGAVIIDATIADAKVISLAAEKITSQIVNAQIANLDWLKVYNVRVYGDALVSGTVKADKFESALYGDLNQAMNFTKTVLSAGDEYKHILTQSDMDAGTGTNIDKEGHLDYGVNLRIFTDVYWDKTGAVWDTGTWDIPTLASADWTSAVNDLGVSKSLQMSLEHTLLEDSAAATSYTVKLQYSTDNISWGANSPSFDDGLWETCSIKLVTGNIYRATGNLYTFRYYKCKIEISTTDTAKRIIFHTLTYYGNVVNIYTYLESQTVAAGGTSFPLKGFNSIPAICVTAKGTAPLVGLITAASSTSFTVNLYNLAGTDVGGTADMVVMGV